VSAVTSSRASSSSSESIRMMTLPSPGGPRSIWLSSPNSLRAKSSSHKKSGRSSSSSEERSTTKTPSESPTCSHTGEGGLCEDTSSGDTGGNRDSEGDGGGVEAPLEEDEEPLPKECERLVPLLFSIANK
jgi:hypothetical protein